MLGRYHGALGFLNSLGVSLQVYLENLAESFPNQQALDTYQLYTFIEVSNPAHLPAHTTLLWTCTVPRTAFFGSCHPPLPAILLRRRPRSKCDTTDQGAPGLRKINAALHHAMADRMIHKSSFMGLCRAWSMSPCDG